MITRNEYIKNSRVLYADYYRQFATDEMRRAVVEFIGLDMIQASTDEHFNDIPLEKWDNMFPLVAIWTSEDVLTATGEFITPSFAVCVLKNIAHDLKEG